MQAVYSARGSITIILLIILLPTLVFSGLTVDISRRHLARAAAEEAGKLVLNSVLADYDTVLKDVYGLFAISQQPGLTDAGRSELLMEQFRINLGNVGLLAPVLEELLISPIPESSLANPEIVEKGILEFMEYRAPAETALSLLDALAVFERIGDQSRVAEQKMIVELALRDISADCAELYRIIDAYDAQTRLYKNAEKHLIESILDIRQYADTESKEYSEKYDQLLSCFHNWKELSPLELAGYAIKAGDELLAEMKTAGIEMEKFSGCVEEYGKRCDSKAEDSFYRAMRGEDDRYESSFSPEQVEELLSQLRAGKNYLGLRNFETVEEYIASLHGDFDESFGTGAGSYYYSDNTYLKPIGETLSIGGKVIGVPPFHICLMSAYGDDAGENGSEYGNGKDLRKSVRGINDRIKEQASVEEAYAYSMDLFEDVPSGINSGNPSVFEDIDGDSNYGAVSQYRSMSATVANLLSILEEGIRGIRDNLFISEYVKQNFSCLTTKADQTTMTGTPIDQEHNRIYGCEIEYILFGNKGCKEKKFLWFTVREEAGPESNLATAKISIFAVRFVCNSIFALTDTEIDQITLAPAISIQAASGGLFPYRLAQVTMKLALALAESFVDLDSLIHGEKVPILKSKLTWRCSVQGILEMLRGRVTEEISEAVQKGFQKGVGFLQRCVDDTADFTAESAGEYIEGLSADLRTAITANIEQAVSSVIMSLREAAERGFAEIFSRASFSRDDFIQSCREELSGIFEGFDEETQEVLSGVLPLIENDVIRSMSDILSDIASDAAVKAGGGDTIYVLEEALCSRITSEISDIFSSFIEQAENEIKGRIDRIIASASDDLKSSISSYGDRLSKTAAEKLTETAVELLDRYLPSSGDMQLPAGDMDLGGEDIPSLKLGLFGETIMCLSYCDYLQILLLLKLCGPRREEILLRIADVIQLNLALSHKSGDAFRMSKAYTYAEIKAAFRIPSLILPPEFDTSAEEYHDFAGY